MKKAITIALILALSAGLAFSQGYRGQGRLKGTVTDEGRKPLEGVKVKVFSVKGQSGFELTTNAKGEWSANYIRGGGYNLDFLKPGYEPRSISVSPGRGAAGTPSPPPVPPVSARPPAGPGGETGPIRWRRLTSTARWRWSPC